MPVETVDCTDPQALIEAGRCLACIPNGLQGPVMIWLLQQIARNTMTPNELMAEVQSKCLGCIPAGSQQEVITWLLCTIANAG